MSKIIDRIAAVVNDHAPAYSNFGGYTCDGCDWDGGDTLADHERHVAAEIVGALGLTQEWAAADEQTSGTVERTEGRTPEKADRWLAVDEPGWVRVTRYVTRWER